MNLEKVAEYYSAKFAEHGATSKGVDWNPDGHWARFDKFLPLLETAEDCFSILDFGSGYGALADFLFSHDFNFSYVGVEIVDEMREVAGRRFQDSTGVSFLSALDGSEFAAGVFDFVVASGTFNVKLDADPNSWKDYVYSSLINLSAIAKRGISVNFLSSNAEIESREQRLFYAEAHQVANFVRREISPRFLLDHSYSRWEFTISTFFEG